MKMLRGILFLFAAATAPVYGQGSAPLFTASYNFSDGNLRALSDRTVITFPAVDVNATATAVITIANSGNAAGVLTDVVLTGSGFQLSGLPLLPATVPAGQAVRFGLAFTPTRVGSFAGSFRIDLTNLTVSGSLAGSTAPPNFSLSYVDPRTNNIIGLANGATLRFPDTPAGAAATVTILAPNTGAGAGEVNSVVLENACGALELVNLVPLPVSVPPSQQLRFGIRFSAPQPQECSGTLSVDLNGNMVAINLAARATGPQFLYTYGPDSTALPAGGTLAMPDTAVGQTASVTMTVLNAGTGNGQIGGIGTSGPGFTATDLPLLPATIRPNEKQQFTLNFAPAQPGALTGRLAIGTDTFTITGKGVGPRLTYAYKNGAAATTIAEGGAVLFPPTAVGEARTLEFVVQNAGTDAATISSISVSAGDAFTLLELPTMPLKLAPESTVAFSIVFSPNTTGSMSSTLRVNTAGFAVSATGTQPPPLPSFDFTGVTANARPSEQPTVGLALASSYPMAVQGTLTLTFVSDVFTDDPAIQFASGGRTARFTIPANSTAALFNGGPETAIALQTGTTAGSIVITPSFTLSGKFDLTPAPPPAFTINVPRMAPTLVGGSIAAQTLSAFSVVLSGYSTTRNLRQLDIQIAPKPGENFSTSHLTLDIASAAAGWYLSAPSQAFGGGFQVTIPFLLQNGGTGDDLVRRLQSISITASNENGTSPPLVIAIP